MAKKSLKEGMQELPAEEKQRIAEAFARYNDAKNGNGDFQTAYNEVRDILKDLEKKQDITIFVPLVAEEKMVDMIAAKVSDKVANKVADKVEAQISPQPSGAHYTCTFQDLAQANDWLAQQRNVTVTNLQVETSRVGLDIKQIRLEYKIRTDAVQKQYRIIEVRKHRFFIESKLEKFRTKWQEENPHLQYVSALKRKWGFFLLGGSIGFFRYIKETYIILALVKNI